MILREIGFNNKNVTSFLGGINELSYIGIGQTFDSEITRIYDKKRMNDILTPEIFGVISRVPKQYGNLAVRLYVLSPEEITLLGYIDSAENVTYRPNGVVAIDCHIMLDRNYKFLIPTGLAGKGVYWSLLELLLSYDFTVINNYFFIRCAEFKYIRYKINCSETELRRFLAKVKVLKR